MRISLPDFSLVLAPHASNRGAQASLVHCVPPDALLHARQSDALLQMAERRLTRRELVVVAAPLDTAARRQPWHELAKRWHAQRYALLFEGGVTAKALESEGFTAVYAIPGPDALRIDWKPLPCDKRELTGPFDIVGDVHGCCEELEALLRALGYAPCAFDPDPLWKGRCLRHPEGRQAVFLGDVADRGPCILESYRLVRNMLHHGGALCVSGNHDIRFRNYLQGKEVALRHGLEKSVEDIQRLPPDEQGSLGAALVAFIDALPRHLVLEHGNLVVAHAGLEERLQLRYDATARRLAMWGPTTGKHDEFGLPQRLNWAAQYAGRALVVYGHTPVLEPAWQRRTVNIDTGCVFGGALSALRYPELEVVAVPAKKVYVPPPRPIKSLIEFLNG